MSLEIKRMQLNLKKLEVAKEELEFKKLERLQDIERIDESIKIQIEAINNLTEKIREATDV